MRVPYHQVKGDTCIFGYIDESGEKTPVRMLPMFNLDPVKIKVQLQHIQEEFCKEEIKEEMVVYHKGQRIGVVGVGAKIHAPGHSLHGVSAHTAKNITVKPESPLKLHKLKEDTEYEFEDEDEDLDESWKNYGEFEKSPGEIETDKRNAIARDKKRAAKALANPKGDGVDARNAARIDKSKARNVNEDEQIKATSTLKEAYDDTLGHAMHSYPLTKFRGDADHHVARSYHIESEVKPFQDHIKRHAPGHSLTTKEAHTFLAHRHLSQMGHIRAGLDEIADSKNKKEHVEHARNLLTRTVYHHDARNNAEPEPKIATVLAHKVRRKMQDSEQEHGGGLVNPAALSHGGY